MSLFLCAFVLSHLFSLSFLQSLKRNLLKEMEEFECVTQGPAPEQATEGTRPQHEPSPPPAAGSTATETPSTSAPVSSTVIDDMDTLPLTQEPSADETPRSASPELGLPEKPEEPVRAKLTAPEEDGSQDLSTVLQTPSEKITFKTVSSSSSTFFKKQKVEPRALCIPETPPKGSDSITSTRRGRKRLGDHPAPPAVLICDLTNESSPSMGIPLGMARRSEKPAAGSKDDTITVPELESSQETQTQLPLQQQQQQQLQSQPQEVLEELGELPVVEIPSLDSLSRNPRMLTKLEFLSALQMLVGNIHLVEDLTPMQLAGCREKLRILTAECAAPPVALPAAAQKKEPTPRVTRRNSTLSSVS